MIDEEKSMSNFVKIAVFVGVSFLLNRTIDLIFRFMSKKNKSVHLRFTKSIINVAMGVVMIYSLLQQFEVTRDISKVLLQSGSLMVAIATFAAQQALANVISGISLSMSRPYNVDEKIRVLQGSSVIAEGIVKDITIRHTIIRQFNGECCIVPNSVMDTAVITNTNFIENVGNFMEIEISYDSDVQQAMDEMQRICMENELTLNTEANKVLVKTYTSNGIVLRTTVWTRNLDDSFQACSDIRVALVEDFREKGITIPYQTVTIH